MNNNLTEEEQARILAYADKALSSAEMATTRQWIEQNPEAQELLGIFDQSALPYAEAMAPMLDIPLAENIVANVAGKSVEKPNSFWRQTIAAIVLLGAGTSIGMVVQNASNPSSASPESWVAQVANYQQLYVRPTVDVAGPVNYQTLAEMIETNLGQPMKIPDFGDHGIAFRRGQLLQVDGNPLIQFAYLPENGLPVAFCVMKDNSVAEGTLQSGKSHGLNYQSWNNGGLRFVLLGDLSESKIQSLATAARAQLDST